MARLVPTLTDTRRHRGIWASLRQGGEPSRLCLMGALHANIASCLEAPRKFKTCGTRPFSAPYFINSNSNWTAMILIITRTTVTATATLTVATPTTTSNYNSSTNSSSNTSETNNDTHSSSNDTNDRERFATPPAIGMPLEVFVAGSRFVAARRRLRRIRFLLLAASGLLEVVGSTARALRGA